MKSYKSLFIAGMISLGFVAIAPVSQAQPNTCQENYVLIADGVGGDGVATVVGSQYYKPGYEVRNMPDNPDAFAVIDSERRIGTDNIKGNILQIQRDCPNSGVYVIGHSLGALEAGDAIEELEAEGNDLSNVKADLIADPRHPKTGVEINLPNIVPGVTMQGERGSFGEADVRQTCRQYDGVCDWDGPPVDQVQGFAGYLNGSHSVYPIPAAPPTATEQVWVSSPPPIRFEAPLLPAYVPTPVSNYLPPEAKNFLPPEVLNFVPPPLF